MNFDQRNEWGFPLEVRLQKAKEYASGAAVRKQERECSCQRCKDAEHAEKLAAVQNILAARQ